MRIPLKEVIGVTREAAASRDHFSLLVVLEMGPRAWAGWKKEVLYR